MIYSIVILSSGQFCNLVMFITWRKTTHRRKWSMWQSPANISASRMLLLQAICDLCLVCCGFQLNVKSVWLYNVVIDYSLLKKIKGREWRENCFPMRRGGSGRSPVRLRRRDRSRGKGWGRYKCKNYAKRDTRARHVWKCYGKKMLCENIVWKCCVKMLCENVVWKFYL